MAKKTPETHYDSQLARAKNNRTIAVLLLIGAVLVGLASVTDAISKVTGAQATRIRPKTTFLWNDIVDLTLQQTDPSYTIQSLSAVLPDAVRRGELQLRAPDFNFDCTSIAYGLYDHLRDLALPVQSDPPFICSGVIPIVLTSDFILAGQRFSDRSLYERV